MDNELFKLYVLAELSYKSILVILMMMSYFLVDGMEIELSKENRNYL